MTELKLQNFYKLKTKRSSLFFMKNDGLDIYLEIMVQAELKPRLGSNVKECI